ncbi:MAG: hypothetical protein KF784_16015 [Fimbriimonadaceae bacterium]|jgi:N-ethylmaleimide reductase|nr:hypothetical protein [Fimbriimonadaceae bacterium]
MASKQIHFEDNSNFRDRMKEGPRMKTHDHLLSPVRVGPYTLRNRLVMAPMTRNRAGHGNVPQPMNVLYYAQRSSAGLIVTEGTQVSPQGVGYPYTPVFTTQSKYKAGG